MLRVERIRSSYVWISALEDSGRVWAGFLGVTYGATSRIRLVLYCDIGSFRLRGGVLLGSENGFGLLTVVVCPCWAGLGGPFRR